LSMASVAWAARRGASSMGSKPKTATMRSGASSSIRAPKLLSFPTSRPRAAGASEAASETGDKTPPPEKQNDASRRCRGGLRGRHGSVLFRRRHCALGPSPARARVWRDTAAGQAELLHVRPEGVPCDSEHRRRLADVPTGPMEGGRYMVAHGLIQRLDLGPKRSAR